VTVAVLDDVKTKAIEFNDRDFRVEWYSGTGAGGQHRNKHQNSCRVTHKSGVIATAQCRSRENSFDEAKATILARLNGTEQAELAKARSVDRKEQTGSGERGDKIRTYRFQDNQVKDHRNNATAPINLVLDGKFNLLW
jgi:peptide chain release factor 1